MGHLRPLTVVCSCQAHIALQSRVCEQRLLAGLRNCLPAHLIHPCSPTTEPTLLVLSPTSKRLWLSGDRKRGIQTKTQCTKGLAQRNKRKEKEAKQENKKQMRVSTSGHGGMGDTLEAVSRETLEWQPLYHALSARA